MKRFEPEPFGIRFLRAILRVLDWLFNIKGA